MAQQHFRFGAALLVAALAALPARAEKVVFGYFPVTDYLMTFIAKDRGFFAEHGIDATIQMMTTNATSIPAALVGNSIQVGAITMAVVLQAEDSGLDIRLLANGGVTYDGYHAVALVVPNDSPVKTAKDLEGKTIGLTGLNNAAQILLVKWLSLNGADPAKVHYVEANIQQMPDIIRTKQLDGVVAIDPFLSRIIASGTGRVLAYDQDVQPNGSSTMAWAVTEDFARGHPELIKGIRAALDEAMAYHLAHPEDDEATLEHYIPIPPAILKTLPPARFDNSLNPAQVTFLSDTMLEQKLLTKPADPAKVILP